MNKDDLDAQMRPSNQGDLLHDSHSGYGGEALRAEREKAGVDIPTLSSELRIPKSYIYALEAEDYATLPGTTYGFGYIKSYCKFLGIDDTPFLDTYKMRTSMASNGPKYYFPDEALEPKMSGAMTAMLVVLTLLSGYIGWQVYDRTQGPSLSEEAVVVAKVSVENEAPAQTVENAAQETDTSASVAEVIAAEESAQPASASQDTQEQTSVQAEETVVAEAAPAVAPKEEAAEEVTEDVVQTASQDDVTQDSAAQDISAENQGASSAQANIRLPSEEIVISANAAAWVEVVSENGDIVLSKLFQAGEDYIAPADKKLYLSTGNAGGLTLLIPGLDAFQAGAVGEIIRDLPLSRESIRSRRSTVTQ